MSDRAAKARLEVQQNKDIKRRLDNELLDKEVVEDCLKELVVAQENLVNAQRDISNMINTLTEKGYQLITTVVEGKPVHNLYSPDNIALLRKQLVETVPETDLEDSVPTRGHTAAAHIGRQTD